VFVAVVVSTVDVLTSQVHNLHACRSPKGQDGIDPTCADTLLAVFTDDAAFPHSRHAADAVLRAAGVEPVPTETPLTEAVPVPKRRRKAAKSP
jgi:hypothetical protein